MGTDQRAARGRLATGEPRSLVFLHVPKTGGTTLGVIAARHFPQEATYKIDGLNRGLDDVANELRQRVEQSGRSPQFIHGHFPFGLHELLPQTVDYVTLIRDPVDRIVSVYNFAKRRPEWQQYYEINDHKLSLHDFVMGDLSSEFHNQQSKMLGGGNPPSCEEALLRSARSNLARARVVGTTDRFDAVLMLCARLLGWTRLHYARRNVNRRRPQLHEISSSDVAAIKAKNAADLELYQTAQGQLDAQIAEFAEFAGDLRRFQMRNALFDLARPINDKLVWLKSRRTRQSRPEGR
jgi:hypothetical protein